MLPEEQELSRLEAEQAELEEQVISAELELETAKMETARFHYRYHQTVGRLYAEVDTLDARIARIRAGLSPADDVLQAEAEAAERKARESAEEAGLVEVQPAPPVITPELKQAWRQAAKLMHPDRATTDHERERRTVLMAQVNGAYEAGDQKAIEKLIVEFGQDPEAITGEDMGARIIKTIRRNAQLRRRLNEVTQELEAIKQTEIYKLWKTVTETELLGGDPLGDLARALMQEISERKIQLEMERLNTAA
jgi:hypothetical protein